MPTTKLPESKEKAAEISSMHVRQRGTGPAEGRPGTIENNQRFHGKDRVEIASCHQGLAPPM